MSYKKKCEKCGMVIEALTAGQAEFLMGVHMLGKKCRNRQEVFNKVISSFME